MLPQSQQDSFLLFSPTHGHDAHLLDQNQNIVHTWVDHSKPGMGAKLSQDGNLIRSYKIDGLPASFLGGSGGGIHQLNMDGTEVWDFQLANQQELLHHDFCVLPNGNILLLVWEDMGMGGAIAAGRNPSTLQSQNFWSERVIELEPSSGTIVWEWRAWDHVIQDFDPVQANYGVVGNHPELIDVNFPEGQLLNGDWIHLNTVDYHEAFDQVVLSSRYFSEIWVIDHSTTTAEAASHAGGNYGRGGDLLYRWGNPAAYDAGTSADQMLFGQHDIQWIPADRPGGGNFLVYNNGLQRPGGFYSSVDEFTPPVDIYGNYALTPGQAYGPTALTWTYDGGASQFYSSHVSGCERLPDGTTLICDGPQGHVFQVESNGTVVWDWTSSYPSVWLNSMFKARRYDRTLWVEEGGLAASALGDLKFHIVRGNEHAGKEYQLLGTKTGTFPGTMLAGGLVIPLNGGSLFDRFSTSQNDPRLARFQGTLDSSGSAQPTLTPSTIPASMIGQSLHFAFMTLDPLTGLADFTSHAVSVSVGP